MFQGYTWGYTRIILVVLITAHITGFACIKSFEPPHVPDSFGFVGSLSETAWSYAVANIRKNKWEFLKRNHSFARQRVPESDSEA